MGLTRRIAIPSILVFSALGGFSSPSFSQSVSRDAGLSPEARAAISAALLRASYAPDSEATGRRIPPQNYQVGELTASDGATSDNLGTSVAIYGNTVVAGSPRATVGANSGQGAVYVFVRPQNGWQNLTQTAKLTASDGAAGDQFGFAVSINASTIIVGSPHAAINENFQQGAAYIFSMPRGGWRNMTQTAKLTSSDGAVSDNLGFSVSVNGNTAIAGAPNAAIGANFLQGAAYAFKEGPNGWVNTTELEKLVSSDGESSDRFGWSVTTSPTAAVVGAPDATIGLNFEQGATYVFVQTAQGNRAVVNETAKLTAGNGTFEGRLGLSAAIYDATVAAGGNGTAYVFVEPPGGWVNSTQTAQLTASDGTSGNNFGISVAAYNNVIGVGAPNQAVGQNSNQGAEYLYKRSASGWQNMNETLKIAATNGMNGDAFGSSVGITAADAVSGAPGATIGQNPAQGASFVFGKP